MDNRNQRELLEAQMKRVITKMFKDFLVIIEDVRQDHLHTLADMRQFPPEFVAKWNYLDLPKYSRIRKKVLDSGNDSIREMQQILQDFTILIDNKNGQE